MTFNPVNNINTVIIKPVYNSPVLIEEMKQAIEDVKSITGEVGHEFSYFVWYICGAENGIN